MGIHASDHLPRAGPIGGGALTGRHGYAILLAARAQVKKFASAAAERRLWIAPFGLLRLLFIASHIMGRLVSHRQGASLPRARKANSGPMRWCTARRRHRIPSSRRIPVSFGGTRDSVIALNTSCMRPTLPIVSSQTFPARARPRASHLWALR